MKNEDTVELEADENDCIIRGSREREKQIRSGKEASGSRLTERFSRRMKGKNETKRGKTIVRRGKVAAARVRIFKGESKKSEHENSACIRLRNEKKYKL